MQKLEVAGIEVNRERKHLRLRTSPEHRYTRCDTLKGDYTEQAIRERIAGTRKVTPRRTSYKKPAQKIGMLVDIEAALRAGKGPGYERWAKVFNIKQLFQAVLYLKEHGDMNYTELKEKSDSTTANFNAVSAQIKELESKMNANAELQKQIVNYAKTRAVYVEYRKAGYSKSFGQRMRRTSFCTRRRRNILTSWGSQSCLLSRVCGKNTLPCWSRSGKPTLLISRTETI